MRAFTRLVPAALAGVLALALAPAPDAQAQELARVFHVTPTDGGAFEAALKSHARDRIEHEDPWSWGVYEIVAGENLGDFLIRSGGHDWADFDAYDADFGPRAGLHFRNNVAPVVKDMASWITEEDTERSRLPTDEEWEEINLIHVITYHLKPAMAMQFNEAVGTIHGAIEAADWPVSYAWADVQAGLPGPVKVLALFYEDWADFEAPEPSLGAVLQSELGEEETQNLMERFTETYHRTESMVLHWRRDLSVPPPGMRGGQ